MLKEFKSITILIKNYKSSEFQAGGVTSKAKKEAVIWRCSVKKMFLWHRCFPGTCIFL